MKAFILRSDEPERSLEIQLKFSISDFRGR